MKSPAFRVQVSPVVGTTDKPAAAAVQVTVPLTVPLEEPISVGTTVKTVCLPLNESMYALTGWNSALVRGAYDALNSHFWPDILRLCIRPLTVSENRVGSLLFMPIAENLGLTGYVIL